MQKAAACGLIITQVKKSALSWGTGLKGPAGRLPVLPGLFMIIMAARKKFGHLKELMTAVDKSDSGQLTADEITNPQGWILLSFVMDPRTGLGRFRDYRISNYQLMDDLIEYCGKISIQEILQIPMCGNRLNAISSKMICSNR